jgi:hypothetical protein
VIAVRVLHQGAVVREHVIGSLPATIGRDPASNVVLFDASVSRAHARLEESPDGSVVLRDLGSRNGCHVGPARVESVRLDGPVRCRLGRAELEVVLLSAADTLSVPASEWHRFERRRGIRYDLACLAVGVLGSLALSVLDPAFWSPWNKQRTVAVLTSVLLTLVLLPVLSFVLFILARAVGRHVRMSDTLQVLSRVVWVWVGVSVVSLPAYYVLSTSLLGLLQDALFIGAAATTVVAAAAVRRERPSVGFRLAWAVAVAAIAIGFGATHAISSRKSGVPQLDFYVQPPLAGYPGPSQGLEAYLRGVSDAAARAARAAEQVRVKQDAQ